MNYCIVRTTETVDGTLVNIVYGPYDEQGCSAAYRKLRAAGLADGKSSLLVRGLFSTGDARLLPGQPIIGEPIQARFSPEALDALRTEAYGVEPGATRVLDVDIPEA